MHQYIIRRLLWMVFILFGISVITFALTVLLPSDPARLIAGPRAQKEALDRIREQWGLDKPVHFRYVSYMSKMLRGDWGRSFYLRVKVLPAILQRAPATLQLAAAGVLLMLLIGLPVGLISALKQYSLFDRASMLFALLGICTPGFVLGILLLYYFGFKIPIFPLGGYGKPSQIILPALTIGLTGGAWYARIFRSSVLDIANADHVRTARAKGLREQSVVSNHVVRNSLSPIVTMFGSDLGYLLGGVLVVEKVFAWPGIGLQAWTAIEFQDVPMIMGTVLFASFFIVMANLFVDLTQALVDPRIRYT